MAARPRMMRLNRKEPRASIFEVDEELYKKRKAADADMMVNHTPENERVICNRAQM
jgi:hypothetical protein